MWNGVNAYGKNQSFTTGAEIAANLILEPPQMAIAIFVSAQKSIKKSFNHKRRQQVNIRNKLEIAEKKIESVLSNLKQAEIDYNNMLLLKEALYEVKDVQIGLIKESIDYWDNTINERS